MMPSRSTSQLTARASLGTALAPEPPVGLQVHPSARATCGSELLRRPLRLSYLGGYDGFKSMNDLWLARPDDTVTPNHCR